MSSEYIGGTDDDHERGTGTGTGIDAGLDLAPVGVTSKIRGAGSGDVGTDTGIAVRDGGNI